MEKQNENQDQPSATIHFSGETLVKEMNDSAQEQISKLEALQTESGQRIIELVERVEKLKKQLSTAQNIVDEQTNSQRQVVNDSIFEHREQMYNLFESIPHFDDWLYVKVSQQLESFQNEGLFVERDDVQTMIEDDLGDIEEVVSERIIDMQVEGTLVDRDDVQTLICEAIDTAKEDAQTIATEKIEDLIRDALDSVEVESHLIY
mgnify:CR=1 FL=1